MNKKRRKTKIKEIEVTDESIAKKILEESNSYDYENYNSLERFEVIPGGYKEYCFKCRKNVQYTIEEKTLTSTYNGITISFEGKEVTCINCGNRVSVREITNENIKKAHAKFKEKGI